MIRDVIGMLLFWTAGALVLLSWFLLRSGRVKHGAWVTWPPSLDLLLAGVFNSLGLLVGILGLLAMGGSEPIYWWGITICVYPTACVMAFWWFWSRADKGGPNGGA